LKIPQVGRPGLENRNFGLAVFPWKKPVGHAFNKIKTPLFSKRIGDSELINIHEEY
jgi:hypothetical protein